MSHQTFLQYVFDRVEAQSLRVVKPLYKFIIIKPVVYRGISANADIRSPHILLLNGLKNVRMIDGADRWRVELQNILKVVNSSIL